MFDFMDSQEGWSLEENLAWLDDYYSYSVDSANNELLGVANEGQPCYN